jgi:hypothetical protein
MRPELQKTFYIHNTTRHPATRDLRRSLHGPESSTKNLFIGGILRLVRGRPVAVSEAFVRQHQAELADKEAKGLLAVYTHNSLRIDLSTLEVKKNARVEVLPPPEEQEEEAPQEDASLEDTAVGASCPDDAPLKELAEEAQGTSELPAFAMAFEGAPEPSDDPPTSPEVPEGHAPSGRKRRR